MKATHAITDVHPEDARYSKRKRMIGKKVYAYPDIHPSLEGEPWVAGHVYIWESLPEEGPGKKYSYAIKLKEVECPA